MNQRPVMSGSPQAIRAALDALSARPAPTFDEFAGPRKWKWKRKFIDGVIQAEGLPDRVRMRFEWPAAMPERAKTIVRDVCAAHKIPLEIFYSSSRNDAVTRCRFECMYRLRHEVRFATTLAIARWVGRSDHTTVIHGLKRWEAMRNAAP